MRSSEIFIALTGLHLYASASLLRHETRLNATSATAILQRNLITTNCKGNKLGRYEKIFAGESVCSLINNEMVYFGVTSEPMKSESGYVMTNIRMWSEFGTFDRNLRGFGIRGYSPSLTLQEDANLVMYGNTVSGGCQAKPASRGPGIELEIGGPLSTIMTIRDDEGATVWRFERRVLSNGRTTIVGSGCYPDESTSCVPVLRSQQRLSWNEYICDYGSDGDIVSRFGLDKSGLLGLWNDESLQADWQPRPGHLRGDYLHLQEDGHLTLYQKRLTQLHYIWKSKCVSEADTKIIVSDHEVHQHLRDGSVSWALVGSAETDWQDRCFMENE